MWLDVSNLTNPEEREPIGVVLMCKVAQLTAPFDIKRSRTSDLDAKTRDSAEAEAVRE